MGHLNSFSMINMIKAFCLSNLHIGLFTRKMTHRLI